MFDSLPQVLDWRESGFVALGNGEPKYEQFLTELAQSFPGRVFFHRGYSDELAHWIEAACDMFVMPSLYEPCGLNQMYSLRYGTVPIVRKTGGLADSVENYDPDTGQGTGIVFNDYDSEALEWGLNMALDQTGCPSVGALVACTARERLYSRGNGRGWSLRGALSAPARVS